MAPGRRLTVNRNPLVNRSTNRNTSDINSGIDAQMLNQLIATRVAEALAAAAMTHAASTQEETNLSWNLSSGLAMLLKELRENSDDKQKWNGNHYNNNNTNNIGNFNHNKRPDTARVFTAEQVFMLANYHSAGSVVDTTLTHALLPTTTVVGKDIRPRNVELHLVLQAKEDPEPKEGR
ncbi:hypothetical protein Tco_0042582, partial [Tanacetum coccineum]